MNNYKTVKDKSARTRAAYICVQIAIILGALALGCMSVISSCEPQARYLSPSVMVTLFWVTLSSSIIFSFGALFLFNKDPIKHLNSTIKSARVARISNILPAVLSVLIALFALFEESLGKWGNSIMIFAAISAAFFILKAFIRPISSKAITGIAAFGLCAVIIASLYLDFTIELNSHFKLFTQFAAVGVICGVIADLRSILSAPFYDASKKIKKDFVRITVRGYVFLKLISVALASICSAVVILYFAEGNSALTMNYLLYSFFALAYAVSSTCELIAAAISVVKSHI